MPDVWRIYIKQGPGPDGHFWWQDIGSNDYASRLAAQIACAELHAMWPSTVYSARRLRKAA